jgi:hypothetical protein
VSARTAARASTGMLQDKALKHHARPAARASTGRKQEDPVKHRARPVPRTRTRLFRAALRPPAFVIQVSVATPAQGHAQRVLQASTNLHQAIVDARTAVRASTGMLQDKALKHHALHAARASTGRLQDQPLKHPARHARQASTRRKQEDPVKHRARRVPRTRSRLLRALHKPPALAIWARQDLMEDHARRA